MAGFVIFDKKQKGKSKQEAIRDVETIAPPGPMQAYDPKALVDRAYAWTGDQSTFLRTELMNCIREEK
jgi:hypothetical protein